jgi:hypothetical protein
MDWMLYWFMFPVSIVVAATAMLSGIGGATLFIPIFVIIFPLLGPEFPLDTTAAIGTAVITQFFGFLSGFMAYYRKQLIDFRSALPFIAVAAPISIAGALLLAGLMDQELFLKGAYALLMLILCPVLLYRKTNGSSAVIEGAETSDGNRITRTIIARSGETYRYLAPIQDKIGMTMTATGSFLTGLLGVGIGEVIMPQLVKRNRVPLAVAAATSVFIVIVTIAAASFTQISALMAAGGVNAIPWNLVCYSVPGVLIGGQIGPFLQGKIAQRTMELAIAALFAVIGVSMMWIVFEGQ